MSAEGEGCPGLEAALIKVRVPLPAMLPAAVVSRAQRLHCLPPASVEAEPASQAFGALIAAYQTLSDEGGAPGTLGDALAIAGRLAPLLIHVAPYLFSGDWRSARQMKPRRDFAVNAHVWSMSGNALDLGVARLPEDVRALPGMQAKARLPHEIREAVRFDAFALELPRLRALWDAAFEPPIETV